MRLENLFRLTFEAKKSTRLSPERFSLLSPSGWLSISLSSDQIIIKTFPWHGKFLNTTHSSKVRISTLTSILPTKTYHWSLKYIRMLYNRTHVVRGNINQQWPKFSITLRLEPTTTKGTIQWKCNTLVATQTMHCSQDTATEHCLKTNRNLRKTQINFMRLILILNIKS